MQPDVGRLEFQEKAGISDAAGIQQIVPSHGFMRAAMRHRIAVVRPIFQNRSYVGSLSLTSENSKLDSISKTRAATIPALRKVRHCTLLP
jgi:hypothetical protein